MLTPDSPEILEDTLKSAGFEKIPEGVELEARFSLVNIYHVRGIVLQENGGNTLASLGCKYQDFAFGFGNNLNEIYQYLFHEDFNHDEETWSKDNNTTPPYLIVHISSNKAFTCKSDFFKFKEETDKIFTLNSFSEAKDILKKKESEIIPKLITCLSIYFSYPDKPVQFIPIFREICGKTNLGDIIYDLEMQIQGSAYVLTNIYPSEVKVRIEDSIESYKSFDDQIGILFHAALREDSKFMKFLNFFLVLERYTNQVFEKWTTTINKAAILIPDEIKKKGEITKRFYQCTKSLWEAVDDEDVSNFILMKNIRNDIAHGNNVNESDLLIDVVERLCLKILSITIDP